MTEHEHDRAIDSFVYMDLMMGIKGGVCVKGCYYFLEGDEESSETASDIVDFLFHQIMESEQVPV